MVLEETAMTNVSIDDRMQQADAGELLINVINRLGGPATPAW
jgi:hypothetical protein